MQSVREVTDALVEAVALVAEGAYQQAVPEVRVATKEVLVVITLGLSDGIRASASEIAVDALQSEAVGAGRLGLARIGLASVELASGIWARGLSGCEVEGDRYGVVTPDFLTDVARDLAWHGEHVSLIRVPDGRVEFLRSQVEDVRGGPGRESWVYLLDVESPGGVSSSVTALAGEVFHVRYASRRNYQERGISPLELSAVSGGGRCASPGGNHWRGGDSKRVNNPATCRKKSVVGKHASRCHAQR